MAIIFIRWIDRQHRIETISYQVILAWLKERVVFHSCVIWVHSLLLVQENRGKNSQKWRLFLKRRSVSLSKIVSHPVADPCGYKPGGKLQQHVAATRCSDKSLRVYWRIFVKIFVAATEFCRRNKSHRFSLIWFFATCCSDKILLRRQRFLQKFSCTHEAICRRDVSPHLVAATSRPTCPHGVICRCDVLLQLVA